MENSMSKALAVDSHQEESSWTYYFQDFMCNQNEYMISTTSTFSSGNEENPSLVSDAASSVLAKKYFTNNHQVQGFSLDRSCKKLSFKKRKTKGALVDDALEDTASSPINSPKVCGLNQLDVNQKEKDDTNISREKYCRTSGKTVERSELGFAGRDSDYTELKKKGLCLVPVSMFSNYLG